jgi:exopolyphosphatase / guanosine-5'-triphosphate,3'-diphosphate pyrophosphatase
VRVAVVDIGTNSTRLLVADVDDAGAVTEVERRTAVTRLGDRVDATGVLGEEAIGRVVATLQGYRERIDALGASATTAVLTSAVRDAANGAAFTTMVNERFDIGARTITGDREAALTFAGATSERPLDGVEVVVIDIGGGSTEIVAGRDREVTFHVSNQAGVVRQTERHLHDDPPDPDQVADLVAEVREILTAAVPEEVRSEARSAIAVAGTATSCAAIELELDPYDAERVQGHVLSTGELELLLARLAGMTNDERREVVGLHPDRAPTIVAGVAMLLECVRAFGLDEVEVSEHDILRGAALDLARGG